MKKKLYGASFFLLRCWPWVWEKDSRELPSSFLKRKERKVRWEFIVWICGKWEEECFLEILVILKSQRRDEVELVHCMAGQVLVFGVCQHARHFGFTCVEFQLAACGWNFPYNISCIICLIKTPTMYLII